MRTLHLHVLRVPSRARLQLVRRLLIRGVQRAAHLPPQAAALPGLVLGELARHVVEFGAVAELGQCFFFLGVFLALRRSSVFCGWVSAERRVYVPGCGGC